MPPPAHRARAGGRARRWADSGDSSDSRNGDGEGLGAADGEGALSSSARLVELLDVYGAKGGVHPAPRWRANQEMHAQHALARSNGVYDLADAQVQRATEATMLVSAWSRSGVLHARRHADDLGRSLGAYLEDLLDGQTSRDVLTYA